SFSTSLLALGLVLPRPAAAEPNPERDVYYGEQHVHTSWSFDAFAFGTTLTGPEDFYQYALGKPTRHPGGYEVTITQPLDWAAVTEHSDYFGIVQEANDPESPLRKNSPWLARALGVAAERDPMLAFKVLSATIAKGHPVKELTDPAVVAPVWRRIVEIADKYYEPGKFTTFAAYEWTSTPDARNLHRNIFFLDSKKVPEVPFAPSDSQDPRDLWRWMDAQRAAGNELLAVSHNANLSDGVMFPTEVDHAGRPIDRAWAEARMRNEPLTEMKQVKGQSETTPGLSPNDEFALYEIFVWQLLGAKGAPREYGSYARQAYKDGIASEQARGFNPYKFGMASGSDSHVSVVPYRQENFFGVHGTVDDTAEKRLDGATVLGLNSLWVTPAGLSAVWAEENTREAIFAAMKRKETYSTSGVRITLRFFGGWGLDAAMLERNDWVKSAYAAAVPMGTDLPAPRAEAPSFVVWAMKEADSGNLDRVQIIKGWSMNGQSFEKIYDVAWAGDRAPDPATGKVPSIGSTVDLAKGTYTNTIGAAELKAVWTDPDFDPSLDAFYYARVLEIPTPRWSTIQAAKLGRVPPSGAGFRPTIQERAWSSPIWYTPSADARKRAAPGTTVAELKQQGAVELANAELEKLVVGKTIAVHNTVTGQRIEILYGVKGQRLVLTVDGEEASFHEAGELMHAGEAQYEIRDGRLLTHILGTPFEVVVYKFGDRYVAARSNEFGYANYEVEVVEH
ncbi:MAG: DUF3604 domain-containing protein, partial [Gammaproteobacteria bacterium]|nr:DUF3604 domain-containing protein [Gammaproteobacteria bacterium]